LSGRRFFFPVGRNGKIRRMSNERKQMVRLLVILVLLTLIFISSAREARAPGLEDAGVSFYGGVAFCFHIVSDVTKRE
jgi:hypothetical protein